MSKRYTVKDAVRFETRGVLGGAYLGKNLSLRSLLTHSVGIVAREGDGFEVEGFVLCRGVDVDNIVDSLGHTDEEKKARPTCLRCAERFDRMAAKT
jgi:hypothetical protein